MKTISCSECYSDVSGRSFGINGMLQSVRFDAPEIIEYRQSTWVAHALSFLGPERFLITSLYHDISSAWHPALESLNEDIKGSFLDTQKGECPALLGEYHCHGYVGTVSGGPNHQFH